MLLEVNRLNFPDDEYIIVKELVNNIGSTGWVFEVTKKINDKAKFAMKVLRPDLHDSIGFKEFIDKFKIEARRMSQNKCDNIVNVFNTGQALYNVDQKIQIEVPYIIMEWVEGDEFLPWFKSLNIPSKDKFWMLFKVTMQLLEALAYLHSRPDEPLLHLDIKSANVKIKTNDDNEPVAKLMDFGVAQIIGRENVTASGKHSVLVSTYEINPKIIKDQISELHDQGATVFLPDRGKIKPSLDLHQLQAMLKQAYDKITITELDKSLRDLVLYYEYWLSRLDYDFTEEKHRFDSAKDALQNLKRCIDWPNSPSLKFGIGKNRLPLGTMKYFGSPIKNIVDTDEFQKLRNIKQLGLVHYVYPGAVHTRFEHSLGVYESAIKYMNSITRKGSPSFRSFISEEEITMTTVLALVHDIGHYPFAHCINEGEIPGFPAHEQATADILNNGFAEFIAKEFKLDVNKFLSFAQFCFDSEGAKSKSIPPTWYALRDVLNGPIDADKFDYLRRDAYHSGVKYSSSLDPDRFLDSLIVVADKKMGIYKLAVREKSISSAEMFAVGRYFMYKAIYYNHTARAFDRMLQAMLSMMVKDEDNRPSEAKGASIYKVIKEYSDEKALDYFSSLCSRFPTQASLCNSIVKRNPYKRLLVLYGDKNYYNWLKNADRKLVHDRINERNKYESILREWLKAEGIIYNEGELLIDLPEERAHDIEIPIVDDSSGKIISVNNELWKSITENFNRTARKIRVFVNKLPNTDQWNEKIRGEFEKFFINMWGH